MSPLSFPLWLQPIFPGWYNDARTGQLMPLTDEEVARVCEQHQIEQQQWHNIMRQQELQHQIEQQQWHNSMRQRGLQHLPYGPEQQHMHFQSQYQPPIYNYGNVNVGSANFSIQQSGHGHQNFGSQRARYQQQAPLVSRSSRDDLAQSTTDPSISVNAQTNLPDPPARVQTVKSKVPATPASAPVVATPVVIDLTNDEAANECIAVSQQTTKREAKTASSPRQKVDAKFWRDGSAFLIHKLNNVGNSNQYFLFASLQQIEPPAKRHKYAATHWTSEEATFKDIMAMSLYFIDATEMLYYRMRWDAVESELISSNLSLDEEKKLRDEIATDKCRLQAELSDKRQDKLDRIEKEHNGLWIDNMKRDRFEGKFGMKAIQANRDKAKRDYEIDLDLQRAEERASKRARMEMPKDTPPSAPTAGKAKRKTGGTRTSKTKASSGDTQSPRAKPKTQEKSTGKTMTQTTAPVIHPSPLPTSALEGAQQPSPPSSPELSKPVSAELKIKSTGKTPTQITAPAIDPIPLPISALAAAQPLSPSTSPEPEPAELEIVENPSTLERTMSTAQPLEMPEDALEHVAAPPESEDDSGWADELAAELEESLMADEMPENGVALEHTAAPSEPDDDDSLFGDALAAELEESLMADDNPEKEEEAL